MKRLLLVLVGLLFVGVLATIGAAYLWLRGDGIRSALEQQATAWMHQPVHIGSVNLRVVPRPSIALRDVRVGTPVRMTFGEVDLSAGLGPLLSRRIEEAEMSIAATSIALPLPFEIPVAQAGATPAGAGSRPALTLVSVRSIRLRDIAVSSRGRTLTVSMDSSLSSTHLNVDRLTASSGKTALDVTGLVQLTPTIDARLSARAARLDLDDLAALAGAFATDGPQASSPTASTARLELRVGADTASVSGVELQTLATTLVAQGSRLTMSPLSFGLFGGRYQGAVDVRSGARLRGTVRAQITGLDMSRLAAFGGVPDTITGTLAGGGTFSGEGTTIGQLLQGAAGTGQVSVRSGTLKRLGLVRSVVLFFGRPSGDTRAAADDFDRIDVSFTLARRVLSASAVALRSQDVDLVGAGTMNLDSRALDARVDLSLSEELSAQAGTDLARFTREGSRIVLPARVSGTTDRPRVSIDAAAATRRGLRNEVQRRLGGILGGLRAP